MHFSLVAAAIALLAAQSPARNPWADQYKTRTPAQMAQQFENETRPVYRYRVAIASLLQLKPGMVAAEIGAGSGFLSRIMAGQVGPSGRVIATELDPKMVEYMNERARGEGIRNLQAIVAQPANSGLDPASVDAIAVVNTFSFFEKPADMLQSISAALKQGGVLLVVDFPRVGQGASQEGIDADDVVALATAAGLTREMESGIVPGHYAIRFRKR